MASSVDNIKLAGGTVYYGTDNIGQISEDGISVALNGNLVEVFTAESGTTPIKAFSSGDTVEVTLTFRELDKYILAKALGTVKDTATSSSDGGAGTLSAGREAGYKLATKALTIYPHFVNESTGEPLSDTVSNVWAFRVHKAYTNLETEFLFSPSETVAPEIVFKGIYDTTKSNGNRLWQWSSGLSPEN